MAGEDEDPPGETEPPKVADVGLDDRTERAEDPTTRRVPRADLAALIAATHDDDDDAGPTRMVRPIRPRSTRDDAPTRPPSATRSEPVSPATRPEPVKASPLGSLGRELAQRREQSLTAPTETFGRYTLLGALGRGGMSEVRLAAETRADRSVRLCVVKRVPPTWPKEQAEALEHEGVISGQLRHPNIVELYDAGEVAGTRYLAFELIDGVSIRELQRTLGDERLPFSAVLDLGGQAASALAYAHAARDAKGHPLRVVHRDVTPQNILLERSGRVRVVDFGIARFSGRGQTTRVGLVKGKLGYLAPEQIRGLELDGRTDVFALGLVLAELVSGTPVLPRVLMVVADLEPAIRENLARAAGPVPAPFTELVVRMTAAEVEARPTAAACAEELRRILAQVPRPTPLARILAEKVFAALPLLDWASVVEGQARHTPPAWRPTDDEDDGSYATTIRVARLRPR